MSHAGECKHQKENFFELEIIGKSKQYVPIEWADFCPFCGTPKRLEKPRTLAWMIGSALGVREDYVKNHGGDKAAVEWACKVIDKTEYNGLTFDGYKDWLMDKLREGAG